MRTAVTKKKPQPKIKTSTLTLRLEGNEVEVLEELKRIVYEKSASGAIVKMMFQFKDLKEEIRKKDDSLREITRKFYSLRNAIREKVQAEKEIIDLLKDDPGFKDMDLDDE